MAVQVLIVVVVAHTSLDRAGLLGGVNIAAVVTGNAQRVVLRALQGLIGAVDRLQIAVRIQDGAAAAVHLIPDVGGIGGAADVGRVHIGVDHLNAGLILPVLNSLELGIGEDAVDDTQLKIAVHVQIVGLPLHHLAPVLDGADVFLHNTQHRVHTGLLGNTLPVVHRGLILAGMDLAAIHNADVQLGNGGNIGGVIDIELILIVDGIGGQQRRNQGKQHQKRQNPGGYHRGLVLGEPQQGVLEEAAGLGLQPLVVELGIHLDEPEFLLGDMFKIRIIAHFLDPILMRGSIKP